jgi:hypothetical protein
MWGLSELSHTEMGLHFRVMIRIAVYSVHGFGAQLRNFFLFPRFLLTY